MKFTFSCVARAASAIVTAAVVVLAAPPASAHCDGMDGPVVRAAQAALATGNVTLVLIWVQDGDEREIREAFQRTVAVRALGTQAKELADRYFFETLVRVHRSGEGAPYTGLKPAGRDLGPAIPAADKAVATGSVEPLVQLIVAAVERGVREHFAHVMHTKDFAKADVKAGREHVRAYVGFVHYVEHLYESTRSAAHGHHTDLPAPGALTRSKTPSAAPAQ